MRNFEWQVFVSREVTPSEAKLELEPLKRRKKLVDEETNERNLQIKDFELYQKKKDDSWMEVKTPSTEDSN